MKAFFVAVLPLVFSVAGPPSTSAMTAQELCGRVFEQYGVRAEECDLAEEPTKQSRPEVIPDDVRESHVFFVRGGAALDDDARLQISVLVRVLESPLMSGACLHLIGHSDTSGSAARNQEISRKRAEVVAAALRDGLSNGRRVAEVSSLGEERPLAGLPGNSAYNRRVEILARDCL